MNNPQPYPDCPDCKTADHVIEDTRAGCAVCSKCGLVVKKTVLYEHSEWRNFSDKDGSNKADPNRIGGVFDPLLSASANLATFIGGADGGSRLQKINQMHNLAPIDRKKFKVSSIINSYGSRMSLPQDVKLMARDLVNQILDSGEMSGKNTTTLVASVIYISAKMCRAPRPLKELCAAMNVRRKDVSRIYSDIQKLKAKKKIKIQSLKSHRAQKSDAEMYATKFARILELPNPVVIAITHTAKNVHKLELMHSHQPTTVAACVIWAVLWVKKDDPEVKQYCDQKHIQTIAQVCQVSERNFQTQFKRTIKPKLLDIIPSTYVTQKELVKILSENS